MDILEQCQNWQAQGEFGQIINAVIQIPPEMRAPQLDLYLASALCATSQGWPSRDRLREVIRLCMIHEKDFGKEFIWNYNMGYALGQLGMADIAIHYFEKAKELTNDPEVIQTYIDNCQKFIELPIPDVPFKDRVKVAWDMFIKKQPAILKILDVPNPTTEQRAQVIENLYDVLYTAFSEIGITLKADSELMEVILSPQGSSTKLYATDYFLKHKPAEFSEKFKFVLGTPANPDGEMQFPDWSVKQNEVSTWIEKLDSGKYKIYLYKDGLKKLLPSDQRLATMVLDQIVFTAIGEIPAMRYVDGIELLDSPRQEASFLLSDLANRLNEQGVDLDNNPDIILQNFIPYTRTPDESEDAIIRGDIKTGLSRCMQLVNDYDQGKSENVDLLQADGATAGFFMFFIDPFRGPDEEKKIKQFQEEFIKAIEEKAGKEAFELIGTAIGTKAGYIDFMAWNLKAVLDTAKEFLQNSKKAHAGFHVLRREGEVIGLYDGPLGAQEAKAEKPSTP
ncbi:MAG: hypothetical protein LUC43_08950 [Burkholderiales bacterium]|nr:hypothetical protein [Burkholderiales bacterium]